MEGSELGGGERVAHVGLVGGSGLGVSSFTARSLVVFARVADCVACRAQRERGEGNVPRVHGRATGAWSCGVGGGVVVAGAARVWQCSGR